MKKAVFISKKINNFNKKIYIPGDKSLSIRFVLLASMAIGKSSAYNILKSADLMSSLKAIYKLGINYRIKKNLCEIYGKGLNGFKFKNNTIINAGNSGTLARLIFGLLINSKNTVILKGDKSLKKRDFSRVIKPMQMMGQNIKSRSNKLPIKIKGTNFPRAIHYYEKIGSAQVKSCILLAGMKTPGITKIEAVHSRTHTENFFKYLKLPIQIKKKKNLELIKFKGMENYKGFNYVIPGDISSASFFIVLALLTKNSKILIKNVNVNYSRTGIIDILKKMNGKIKIKNKKIYKGEEIADIECKYSPNLKGIKINPQINSRAIDELPLIFCLACAKAKGISYAKNLGELRHKEQDRLKFVLKFLKMIGVKVIEKNNNLKIYGNPNLKLSQSYIIKNFMKDHRAFMLSCVAALTLGGKSWSIHDLDSINTSFPNFISILKNLGAKIH